MELEEMHNNSLSLSLSLPLPSSLSPKKRFLDESPVSASLGTILFFPVRLTAVEAERKRRFSIFLKNYEFIKKIVKRMGYSGFVSLHFPHFKILSDD